MRNPARTLFPALALLATSQLASAQVANRDGMVTIDTYWLRSSGAKVFDDIEPFRRPMGVKDHIPGQALDLIADLTEMRRLATNANPLQLTTDPDGREICSITAWAQAHENVKSNGLNMEGWLGKIMREDDRVQSRRACIYGMFYFNDPNKVIQLISNLPGEPLRDLREVGFERALRFMRVHYKLSKPQNPKNSSNGVVVPRYEFNPLPFFLLLDQEQGIDKAQALWFLTEVLKIRPDLGRVYLEEVRDRFAGLLVSADKDVRANAVAFLSAIEKKRSRVLPASAGNEKLMEWYRAVEYDLFPPIRHVSLGRCDLYPSEDLDKIAEAGKRILVPALFPPGSARLKSGKTRYGIRLGRLPEPLHKLGLPVNSVIVSVNNHAILDARQARKVLEDFFAALGKPGKKPAGTSGVTPLSQMNTPTIQVEYIFKGRALMKDYRLLK